MRPLGRLLIVEREEQLVISVRRSIGSPLFPRCPAQGQRRREARVDGCAGPVRDYGHRR
jgi:hypothetical protein